MRHTLLLRATPALRVDARALLPAALCSLQREDVLRLPLPHGRDRVPVGEFFAVTSVGVDDAVPALHMEGDLSRFDFIGAAMEAGTLEVHGPAGDCAGLGMAGGTLAVHGAARDLAGCAMRGGLLQVHGDVGDFAAGALAGDMEGMRGGMLCVHGRAGARLGDRMRRGLVAVHGDVGDFAASRMVAGTLAVGGRCGARAGWAMRRGSIVFAGEAPEPGGTFVRVESEVQVAWQLLARELARLGGAFEALPRRNPSRWVGDLAVQGMGEWLVAN